MQTIKSITNMQKTVQKHRLSGDKIVLVPTMGAFHEGHLSLIRKAKKAGDVIVVSLFVNPAQFGESEDLSKYPRSLKQDKEMAKGLGVSYLFLPTPMTMYPEGFSTWVEVERITRVLEGKSRPSHFKGVTTIVAKLFNIVQPDIAIFGQKDAQQAAVIRKMVDDLNIPVKIILAPIVREHSGLAMSSRNRYFNTEQRLRASCIYNGLKKGRELISGGETDPRTVAAEVRKEINATPGVKVDYVSINDPGDFSRVKTIEREVLILVAAELDGIRLIDNLKARPGRSRGPTKTRSPRKRGRRRR